MTTNKSAQKQSKTLVVAGGGAAGFFCAVNAARLNASLKVILLEKSEKLLSKVKVSGGGRCNITHHCTSIATMIKNYPRGANFLKKSFHHFFVPDTIEWFTRRAVPLKTEADGRMFPATNLSQTVINCLLREADKYGVEIVTNCALSSLQKTPEGFIIHSSGGSSYSADAVCLATGGIVRNNFFSCLNTLGYTIVPPVPSLFTFNIPGHPLSQLMGLSTNASIKITGTKLQQQGSLLITHWGLSGPCVLKLSAWGARLLADRNYQFSILVNWLPQYNEHCLSQDIQAQRLQWARRKIYRHNPFGLPQRLWRFFLQASEIPPDLYWAHLSARAQHLLVKNLTAMNLEVKGKTRFKEEFVTAGGVSLSEIDANTMSGKFVPGLYFAGEIIDVDGITGGFNFQNAWTTGFIAARDIAEKLK